MIPPSKDRLYALAWVNALAKLSTRLVETATLPEIASAVHGSLRLLFDSARRVEVFLADVPGFPVAGASQPRVRGVTLCPTVDPRYAQRLLSRLRGRFATPRLVRPEPDQPALVAAPILDGRDLLGLLVLEADPFKPDFTFADLDALVGVAAQVTLALKWVGACARRQQRAELDVDLATAREIQRNFLPSEKTVNGVQIAAEYRPAFDVGGDFYDVVASGDGCVTAVIGDVSGKAVSGALIMSRVSSEFRRLALLGEEPGALLAQLNSSSLWPWPDGTFVTATCVRIDANRRRLTVANAGHVPPILRRQSGDVSLLSRKASAPLGMLPNETYVDEHADLRSGDILLLMTDGVVEALECDGDARRLLRICGIMSQAPHDPREINRTVLAAMKPPRGERRADDVTLLTLGVENLRSIVTA